MRATGSAGGGQGARDGGAAGGRDARRPRLRVQAVPDGQRQLHAARAAADYHHLTRPARACLGRQRMSSTPAAAICGALLPRLHAAAAQAPARRARRRRAAVPHTHHGTVRARRATWQGQPLDQPPSSAAPCCRAAGGAAPICSAAPKQLGDDIRARVAPHRSCHANTHAAPQQHCRSLCIAQEHQTKAGPRASCGRRGAR